MHEWFRTTAEVQLMEKFCLGEVFPRNIFFVNSGLWILAGQVFPVGNLENYPYGDMEMGMFPVNFEGYADTFYIPAIFADESKPDLCLMVRAEKK